MFPINRTVLTLGALGALALPCVADAHPAPVTASVALNARSAISHLHRAKHVSRRPGSRAARAAQRLLAQSRSELDAAAGATEQMAADSSTAAQAQMAAQAQVSVSSALAQDAAAQAGLVAHNASAFAAEAAGAVLDDVRAEQQIIQATLDAVTAQGAQGAHALLAALASAQSDLATETQASVSISSDGQLDSSGQASAQTAAGMGTEALASDAQTVQTLTGQVQADAQSAAEQLTRDLVGSVQQVASVISGTPLEDSVISLPGVGQITLGALARASLTASGSLS